MNQATGQARIICVSSGKGGVGKTSFSVNMATALARKNHKVLLIDGDLGLANVDVVLGINVHHTVQEMIDEGRDPADILIEILPGFFLLPASSGVPEMAGISREDQAYLTESMNGLLSRFDFILIDTAAGIGESVLWFNTWATENIIILTPDPTSMTDAYALIKVLHSRHGRQQFQLVVNNVKSQSEGNSVFTNISTVLHKFLRIAPTQLGNLPQDTNVTKAIRSRKPFLLATPETRASRSIFAMAEKILATRQSP